MEILNYDVLLEIFKYLYIKDVKSLRLVNKFFNKITYIERILSYPLANSVLYIYNSCYNDKFVMSIKENSIELIEKFIEMGYTDFNGVMLYCLQKNNLKGFKLFLRKNLAFKKDINDSIISDIIRHNRELIFLDEIIKYYKTFVIIETLTKYFLNYYDPKRYEDIKFYLIYAINNKTKDEKWYWDNILKEFCFDTNLLVYLFKKKDEEIEFVDYNITKL